MFEQFGNIIDVVYRRTYKLRGQAWVVFERQEDAAKALKAMQGFPFFNKPIVRIHASMCRVLLDALTHSLNHFLSFAFALCLCRELPMLRQSQMLRQS